MSIADQLKKLEKDPNFQKRVAELRIKARKDGVQFGCGGTGGANGVTDKEECVSRVTAICLRLYLKFPLSLRKRMPFSVFHIGEPIVTSNGDYKFDIYFDERMITRESLYIEQYDYNGNERDYIVNNIIELLSHGTKPSKNWVSGYWGGEHSYDSSWYYLPKGYSKAPNPFLTAEVAQINAEMNKDGIKIKLDPKYYP